MNVFNRVLSLANISTGFTAAVSLLRQMRYPHRLSTNALTYSGTGTYRYLPTKTRLKVRHVVEDDYTSIMEMSKGIIPPHDDYLPHVFYPWLRQPSRSTFVGEVNGKIVALLGNSIVDNEETCHLFGMRVHADFQGRKLTLDILAAVEEHARQFQPKICRYRFTTDLLAAQLPRLAPRCGYRAIFQQCALCFHISDPASSIKFLTKLKEQSLSRQETNQPKIEPCNKQYLSDVIFQKPAASRIFDSDLYLHCHTGEVFEANRANIDYFMEDGDIVLKDRCTSIPVSFSHGRFTPREKGVQYMTSIYSNDHDLFVEHVVDQLYHACKGSDNEFSFYVLFNDAFSQHRKILLQGKLGLTYLKDTGINGLIVYEKVIG